MKRMILHSIKKKILIIIITGVVFAFVGDENLFGLDMKTMLYSWFVVIIGFIMYSFYFKITKDYIDKEEEKISFLYYELDYLIDSKIKYKNYSYDVCDIIISRPRNIQKNEWEVSIETDDYDNGSGGFRDIFKILNISDAELEKTINNKKGLKSFINTNITIIKLDEN